MYLMLLASGNAEGHNFLMGVERNLRGHVYRIYVDTCTVRLILQDYKRHQPSHATQYAAT